MPFYPCHCYTCHFYTSVRLLRSHTLMSEVKTAAAARAANTEARRLDRGTTTLLACSSDVTRSEHDLDDLEAAEANIKEFKTGQGVADPSPSPHPSPSPSPTPTPNTANTATAAASITMHRVTGTFADRSHELAFAAQLFRLAFPYHVFLLALILTAALWVVQQAPIDRWKHRGSSVRVVQRVIPNYISIYHVHVPVSGAGRGVASLLHVDSAALHHRPGR